jgi:L-cysteine desulfidase
MKMKQESRRNKMLTKEVYDNYVAILKSELVPALGCTEPIAVAYAAAKAKEVLGKAPKRIEMWCSGNIIKNVKGVTVPNTGGLKGIDAAAIAGVVGGNAEMGLRVLEGMSDENINQTKNLLKEGFCSTHIIEGVENLYMVAKIFADSGTGIEADTKANVYAKANENTDNETDTATDIDANADVDSAEVYIKTSHTNIFKITKNGVVILEKSDCIDEKHESYNDRSLLNIKDILEFANTVNIDDISLLLSNQISMNTAISEEGLKNQYGVDVGKTLLECYGNDVKIRAKARAAAGSDARMSGCSMPVVINSGSGNQGMTVSLPVIEYAKELGVSKEKLYRALVLSNLTAIHQKTSIGRLSAYCGAVSAACGSGAAITYLYGGKYEDICRTIVNTITNIGGMVCDGAKPSCAAKIASAVDAAIMAHHLSTEGKVFASGEGLVKGNVEDTIESVGRMGSKGMKYTDVEILKIMINQ